MNLGGLVKSASAILHKNQPQILLGFAVGGVVSTAYLTVKATWAAKDVIEANEAVGGTADDPVERFKERAKETWPLFVPPMVAGFGTVTCMVLSSRGQARRTAAAVAAYSFVEKGFSDYREKVAEQLGATKAQKAMDSVRQDTVKANPPREIIITGKGDYLCCELYTKRYFRCDVETLRKTVNEINAQINISSFALLQDFYERIGLPETSQSGLMGWENRHMDVQISSIIADDDTPCLAFDYSPLPKLMWE